MNGHECVRACVSVYGCEVIRICIRALRVCQRKRPRLAVRAHRTRSHTYQSTVFAYISLTSALQRSPYSKAMTDRCVQNCRGRVEWMPLPRHRTMAPYVRIRLMTTMDDDDDDVDDYDVWHRSRIFIVFVCWTDVVFDCHRGCRCHRFYLFLFCILFGILNWAFVGFWWRRIGPVGQRIFIVNRSSICVYAFDILLRTVVNLIRCIR